MKNKLLTIATLSLLLVALAGCGGETTVSAPQESPAPQEESADADVISYDNRALCSNEKVDVTLKEISRDGITLTFTNKTADTITVMQKGLAIDHQTLYSGNYALLYEDLIPNTTTDVLISYELDNIQHQSMSGLFELYLNGSGFIDSIMTFSNVDLGYSEDPIWVYIEEDPQSGQTLYEDDQLTCRFYRMVDSMFVVTIENNGAEYFSASPSSLVINGQSVDISGFVPAEVMSGCQALLVTNLPDGDLNAGDTIAAVYQLYDQDHAGTRNFSINMTIE